MVKNKGLYAVKTSSGKEMCYAIGNVTEGFPFLAETEAGQLVTPFYLREGEKVGMVNPGKIITLDGKNIIRDDNPEVEVTLKNLRMPTVAINITEEHYQKVLQHSELAKFIPHQKKINGITIFLPVVAFDEDAKTFYSDVLKGDEISMFGELKRTTVRGMGKTFISLWVKDIKHLKTAQRNLKGESLD